MRYYALIVIALQIICSVTGTKQGRIVGGSIAEEGLAPYVVSLQNNFYHLCGGAIIDTEWIITAAHCVYNKDPEEISVLTGTQDLEDPDGVSYNVDKIYVHCNFNYPSLHYDIALLHLDTSIVLDAKTQIIPLARRPSKDGDDVVLVGWGKEDAKGESVDRLKAIDLKIMSHKRCKKAHNFNSEVHVGHICTFTKEGEGSCYGDSGGPLVSKDYLVGVVSWGQPCALGYPDMYTSTYYYSKWIRSVMKGKPKCKKNNTQRSSN